MVPGSLGCGSVVFPVTTIWAPSRAARSAMASPIPRLQPVMNNVFPASVDMGALYRAGSPAAEAQEQYLRRRTMGLDALERLYTGETLGPSTWTRICMARPRSG